MTTTSAENAPGTTTAAESVAYDLVLRGPRVLVDGTTAPRQVGVRDGRVAAVVPYDEPLEGARTVELGDQQVLLPGLVDTHVHVNEPGRTEWEGFDSATRAAAAGGVTTLIDMPLNSIPPTVDVAALEEKQAVAAAKAHIDVGFWGGAVPGNESDLKPLHDAGVFGFKCFLLHSGVDEFAPLTPEAMEADMGELAEFDSLMIVHAEDATTIESAPVPAGPGYAGFLASRPRAAENAAIQAVIEAARRTGARAHILHLSSSDALDAIRAAKANGVRITVETCPHYLTLEAEAIPDGATAYKCCPPIRERANRDLLWEALLDGTIDCIVSDHSPSTVELKLAGGGDFGEAWGGVSSLQLGLSLIWDEAKRRGIALERVVDWMATNTSRLVGLERKGRIAVGADADFAVFEPETALRVDAAHLHHRNPVTPYDGRELTGVVAGAWVRGEPVDFETPRGELIRRGEA
ncbi:allantoinase AllB [Zhihengliuella salsuginis]|uniref:allantoinase n=1 Tax=Zhihengliuella salsuginis TaxID=578222 RepID=A0ABQ3GMZ0_9MICC|nr:allantoinase AllB [Zhihengliuella salsuginis]GHD12473.1 allantoinase [Zhihengliuella salsuginis]